MRDFGSGWTGLKEYAIKAGVARVDDTDDAAAMKIQLLIQGTQPEIPVPETTEVEVFSESDSDSDSETEA